MPSDLRNLNNSIEYRLWQMLGNANHTQELTGQPMVEVPDGAPNTYGLANPIPWVFMEDGSLSRDLVKVYDGPLLLHPDDYTINFVGGQVALKSTPTNAVTADFTAYTCRVRRSLGRNNDLKYTDIPLITYRHMNGYSKPAAIGTSSRFHHDTIDFTIYASYTGIFDDLIDTVRNYMVKLNVYMFHDYFFGYDGDINPVFSNSIVLDQPMMVEHEPKVSYEDSETDVRDTLQNVATVKITYKNTKIGLPAGANLY